MIINNIIAGLQIFAKPEYGGGDRYDCTAEHDEFRCGPKGYELQVSPEDAAKLKELGWINSMDNMWLAFT